MKKTFISASVASVLALASFGALAEGPSFYGRLDLAVTTTDSSTTLQGSTNKKNPVNYGDSGTYLENNFSWLGVKGSEKVADGVDIVYQMEFGVDNTTNSSDTFNARNTFLGFKTVAGTVLAGRNDTVFKQAEGNVDVFGNTNADIDRLVSAQAAAGRSGDGVWYYSPKIADLVTLNATYLFDDNYGTSDSMYAVSATLGDKAFKEQNYYLAAAYNKAIGGVDAYRGVAQAKFGDFTVGGLFQHAESIVNDNRDGNSYFVNVVYKLQNGVNLKAEYGKDEAGFGSYFKNASGLNNNMTVDLDDVNVDQITIGADYRLVKSTLLFAHYAHYEGDFKQNGVKQDLIEDDVVSIGVRYDF
ncbi:MULTISPECIES: porin [unclassified Shewanella]|uniref:porin n=1 Tax=unclassified Shewanella TaxID=196818 RepID=UPI002004B7AB|nr:MULTISPECIES: porin [unclassified Shewanella]MCK7633469.1 porin [Shewanella sp. JNE17]MCK7648772.1 porin [Shewanella sp. JNE8]MCK7656853.1 porin [Shewanella sp. JNE4-2]UPO31928.1 porin [Shewanella sp. JNE2]